MALGPSDVIPQMSPDLVKTIEELIDSSLKKNGLLKSSVDLPKSFSNALAVNKIREQAITSARDLYLKAGWGSVKLDITGPHSAGCSDTSRYYRVTYLFEEGPPAKVSKGMAGIQGSLGRC